MNIMNSERKIIDDTNMDFMIQNSIIYFMPESYTASYFQSHNGAFRLPAVSLNALSYTAEKFDVPTDFVGPRYSRSECKRMVSMPFTDLETLHNEHICRRRAKVDLGQLSWCKKSSHSLDMAKNTNT